MQHRVHMMWDPQNGDPGYRLQTLRAGQTAIYETKAGWRWYFTPVSDPAKVTQVTSVKPHTAEIVIKQDEDLQRPPTQLETEKEDFLRHYFERTGKRWLNYYPRDMWTEHYMYKPTYVGEVWKITSNASYFVECGECKAGMEESAACDGLELEFAGESVFCRQKLKEPLHFEIVAKCTRPKVFTLENMISDFENKHIIDAGERCFAGNNNSWIDRESSPVIDAVVRRMADVIQIDESKLRFNASAEKIQLMYYGKTKFLESHHDYIRRIPHTRFLTFLIYLNEPAKGGETAFLGEFAWINDKTAPLVFAMFSRAARVQRGRRRAQSISPKE